MAASPETSIVDGDTITVRSGGRTWGPIKVSAEKDPTKVPYQGIDVALECTGRFTKKADASHLITAGARKVLVSAPADGADATIVYGVNHHVLTRDMTVVSNASCTTNCLVPVVEGAARQFPRAARLHGDDPLVHRRPEHGRHAAQGPAPRPRRRRQHHPDQHRRRKRSASCSPNSRASSTAPRSACRRRTCPSSRST